ncbi:MAG TPA: A24 family peptidase [Polyangiaceae bacterium]|nr:A24 family peptidase [Polyangiaceae bacterium]
MTQTNLMLGAAVLVSLCAAATDARTGRIPNLLTLPTAVLGVALHGWFGGRAGAAASLMGLVVAGGIPWLLHRGTKGAGIGGGDVKLFAALGALLGATVGLQLELLAFMLLAVYALVRLAFLGRLFRVLGNALRLLVGPILPAKLRRPLATEALTEMRMGPAIAAAAVSVALSDHVQRFVPWLG